MKPILRVDSHHHVWDLAVRDQPWTAQLPVLRRSFGFSELSPQLRDHHIDGTVLVQTINVAEETPELLLLAAREPMVLGVVGWVDLTAPDVADRIAMLREAPGGQHLVGIRHQVQGELDPRWLCRPTVRQGLAAVADAELVYDLLVIPSQLNAAVETVAAVPGLRFVLDPGGKPRISDHEFEPWRSLIRRLACYENVTCKLSGLVTQADATAWTIDQLCPYADILIEVFGPQRLMFGSDWPVCLLAASYAQVLSVASELTAGLSQTDKESVFGGTASRWYGLVKR